MERPSRKTKLVSTVCGVEKTEQTNLPSESAVHRNAQAERVDVSWTWTMLKRAAGSFVQLNGNCLTTLTVRIYKWSSFPTMLHPTWGNTRNAYSFHIKAISKQNIERYLGNSPLIILPFPGPMSLALSVEWHSCSQKKNNKYIGWTHKLRGEKIWTGALSGLENIEPGFLTLWVSALIQKVPLMTQLSCMTLNTNNDGNTRYVAPIAIKCLCSESIY